MDGERHGPQLRPGEHHHRVLRARRRRPAATNSVWPGWWKPTSASRALAIGPVTSAAASPATASAVAASSDGERQRARRRGRARRGASAPSSVAEHGQRAAEHRGGLGQRGDRLDRERKPARSGGGGQQARAADHEERRQAAAARAAPMPRRSVRGRPPPDRRARRRAGASGGVSVSCIRSPRRGAGRAGSAGRAC